MKWLFLFIIPVIAHANYSIDDAETLVKDLEEFQTEVQKTPAQTKKKKRILSLADILNKDKAPTKKTTELSKNDEVMDLDSIFEKVKSNDNAQTQPVRAKRLR